MLQKGPRSTSRPSLRVRKMLLVAGILEVGDALSNRDLLVVREVYYVCHCSWLFKKYLQINQMYTLDVPRCSPPFVAGWCTNWCTGKCHI
jgi:hypothetical protein